MPFNFSSDFHHALINLRKDPECIQEFHHLNLTSDEVEYLRMENCVRQDQYSAWDAEHVKFESEIIKDLANCYYFLYTNPLKATELAKQILNTYNLERELVNRIKFWLMDSYFLTGHKKEGEELINQLDPNDSGEMWRAESQTIKALCYYFTNDLDDAMKWHLECQKTLDETADYFLSIFNSSMALRVALKLCEPLYFDYFSNIIAQNASYTSEKRYTARIHTYKALLLVQMHRPHEAAEEWAFADDLIPFVEMKWEKGQYYLLRGFSSILCGMKQEGEHFLKISEEHLINAGSPPPYIADLEIAKIFNDWRSPNFLSKGLLNIQIEISRAITYLEVLRREPRFSNVKEMFEDAIDYCHMIISGTPMRKSVSTSLIITILLNSAKAEVFGSGLSDFKTYSSIVNSILSSDSYSVEDLKPKLEQILGFSLFIEGGKFALNESSSKMSGLNKLLSFANNLVALNTNLQKTNELKAMAELSKRLSHDLRSPLHRLKTITEMKLHPDVKNICTDAITSIESMCNQVLFGDNRYLEKRAFNLNSLMTRIIQQKNIEFPDLELQFIYNKPFMIYGISALKIERIISNLINNSIEANATKVSIKLEPNPLGVELIISDNGHGLSDERIHKFNHGHNLISDKFSGSGLGLSSAAEYIKESGGRIVLKSNSGLTVHIQLTKILLVPQKIIHVEDDKYIRRDWLMKAQAKGINLASFDSFDKITFDEFDPDIYYFIDANVAEPLDGLEFAKILFDRGVQNIFLSSGIDLNELENYPFIKAVVDKSFPF